VELSGSRTIDAPRAATWAALTDVDALATCGPSGAAIERLDDRHARIRLRFGSGFFATTVTVALEVGEVVAPDRVTIAAHGQASGTQVDGKGTLDLGGPPEGPTTLAWTVDLAVSGALAGMASRLIETEAARRIDDAVDCIRSLALDRVAS
jgi:carbon monoxide dehydrogenase subunit G